MFLSVDPVTAYQQPISQFHRYRYANSNPYKFIDPDGRIVKVAGSESQQELLNAEIAILRSKPGGEAIYNQLDSSSNIHTIQPTAEGERNSAQATSMEGMLQKDGTPGSGSGSVIKIELDPDKISKPIFLSIAHEMGHGGAMDKGIQSGDFSKADGGGNTPPGEVQSMEAENEVRREHGIPERGPYYPKENIKP